jgi:outer membrane protein assembly factor BamB
MFKNKAIKGFICLLAIMLAGLIWAKGTVRKEGTKTVGAKAIEPKSIMEYKMPEGEEIVDVIFGEATMTVKEARALGMKGLEQKKATETVKVQYPKVVITGKAVRFLNETGKVLSSKNLEEFGYKVWGNVSATGDKVFISSFSKKKEGDALVPTNLFCLDKKGDVLWKREFEGEPRISGNEKYIADINPPDCSVGVRFYNIEGNKLWEKSYFTWGTAEILYDGKVVISTGKILYFVNQNGKELWNYKLEQEIGPGCIETGYGGSKRGNFFAVCGDKLYSFDEKGLLWKADIFLFGNEIEFSKDGNYLCGFGIGKDSKPSLWFINNKNGDLVWKVNIENHYNVEGIDIITKENGDIQILITGRKLEKMGKFYETKKNEILILDGKGEIIYSIKTPPLSQAKFEKGGKNILLTTQDNRLMVYELEK